MLGTIIRFIVSALVIQLTAFLLPGFAVGSFLYALLAAVVIALVGWLMEKVINASPRSRGFIGFIVAALTIYIVQFLVPNFHATIIGALLASLVIGIVDSLIPIEVR